MSRAQWNALAVGDIVVERGSRTPRIVLASRRSRTVQGRNEYTSIVLRMLHFGSWRGRRGCTHTLLNEHDWRPRLSLVFGKRARVTREMQRCCEKHGNDFCDFMNSPVVPR